MVVVPALQTEPHNLVALISGFDIQSAGHRGLAYTGLVSIIAPTSG